MNLFVTPVLVVITVVGVVLQLRPRLKKERQAAQVLKENTQAGVNEPPSLHPLIDEHACIGCGSCVDACPEQPLHSPLGLIGGKAVLVDAAHCIGHGACKLACPTSAIELVFGTEKRGVDIPSLQPNFETNVPGLFIAGELGGMGLIANSIDQGVAAVESIRKLSGIGRGGDRLDVVVVGAGPSGFAASLAAKQANLRCRTVEQGSLGGTVYQFPRGKVVMTRAAQLPLVGKVRFTETSKEKLLEFWQKVERDTKVEIHYHERLEMVTPDGDGFVVKTTVGEYRTRAVLLCLGRSGTPRKLGVPGEDHPKVNYRLIDSREFAGKSVLVVGGGDSALEAAHTIADEPGAKVALSYREKAFTRAKEKNRKKVEQASQEGRLQVLYESKVKAVHDTTVDIEQGGQLLSLPNEAIIVCAGGILPTPFLKEIGIGIETKFGTR
jgi:thioredoxin reductase/NAD-dependent dihydropyrimidine dehydrogenase PreA subunit